MTGYAYESTGSNPYAYAPGSTCNNWSSYPCPVGERYESPVVTLHKPTKRGLFSPINEVRYDGDTAEANMSEYPARFTTPNVNTTLQSTLLCISWADVP